VDCNCYTISIQICDLISQLEEKAMWSQDAYQFTLLIVTFLLSMSTTLSSCKKCMLNSYQANSYSLCNKAYLLLRGTTWYF